MYTANMLYSELNFKKKVNSSNLNNNLFNYLNLYCSYQGSYSSLFSNLLDIMDHVGRRWLVADCSFDDLLPPYILRIWLKLKEIWKWKEFFYNDESMENSPTICWETPVYYKVL